MKYFGNSYLIKIFWIDLTDNGLQAIQIYLNNRYIKIIKNEEI